MADPVRSPSGDPAPVCARCKRRFTERDPKYKNDLHEACFWVVQHLEWDTDDGYYDEE